MKFYNLSRKERRKLKNQLDKTVFGVNFKDPACVFIVLAVLFLVAPFILCCYAGFDAISISDMLTFVGFLIVFIGEFLVMSMLRYLFLKDFYDDKHVEKAKDKEKDKDKEK